MSKLVKDIVDVCLKEDLQRVLQKTTELKEARLSGNDLQSRISSIAKMNKLADPNKIYAGKTLNIDGSKYTIKRGDNLTKIARSFPGAGKTSAPKPATPASVSRPAPRPATPQAPASRPQTTSPVAGKTSASTQAATKPSDQYNRPITGSEPRLPAGRFQSPAVSKATPAAAPTMSMPPEKASATLGANRPDWPGITPNKPQTATTKAPAGPPMPTFPVKFISPIDSGIPGLPKITKRADTTPPPSTAPAPPPTNMSAPPTRSYSLPTSKDTQDDAERAKGAVRGIRSLQAGNIDTKSFEYPGSASAAGRATEPPTKTNVAPEPAPKPEPETNADGSGARKLGIPVPTTPAKPDEPGYSDYMQGAERLRRDVGSRYVPESVNESFVNVGSNKYRIV